MKTIKRLTLVLACLTQLIACSKEIQGDYAATTKFFGMTVSYLMHIQGDQASIKSDAGRNPILESLKVTREPGRVILHWGEPRDGLIFTAKDPNTLECPRCDAARLPALWERVPGN